MSRPSLILVFVSAVLLETRAAPDTRLDFGLYAIDRYDLTGNIMCNLIYQKLSADNFYASAAASVPNPPDGTSPTGGGLRHVDNGVTKAVMTSQQREQAHLVFYSGHGFRAGLFLGGDYSRFGVIRDSDLLMGQTPNGVGSNRWFFANSCLMFGHEVPPPAAMVEAFKGLKAMLGFESIIYDLPASHELWTDFWHRWTTGGSLITAFFSSHSSLLYKGLYPASSIHPGCLSAPVTQGIDYCRQSLAASTLSPALHGTDEYYETRYTKPNY